MKPTFRLVRSLGLAALVALAAIAIAQGMRGPGSGAGMPMHGAPQAGGAAGVPAPMAAMMGAHVVDEASFLVHMIPHHEEAVAAAERLRAVTERPEMQALADAIVTTQTAEIEAMSGWLDQWHPDADRDVAYEPMMRVLPDDAPVADVERAFLEDMIPHHMMAVHDAQTLLAGGLAEHAEVAELARSIVTTQHAEMFQMRTWLGAWFGVAGPMGMGGFGAAADGAAPWMPGPGMHGDVAPGDGMGGYGMGMGGYGMHGYGMGMRGYGARGHDMGGHGMHGYGMGGYGIHGYGMSGAPTPGCGAHDAVAPRVDAADVGRAAVDRLTRAFLAGQGLDASAAVIEDASFVVEVHVRVGDEVRLLRIDPRTGAVSEATER